MVYHGPQSPESKSLRSFKSIAYPEGSNASDNHEIYKNNPRKNMKKDQGIENVIKGEIENFNQSALHFVSNENHLQFFSSYQ